MAGRDSRCSVCQSVLRDEIDRALLAGNRPAEVFRAVAEPAGIARASLYRHQRHVPQHAIGTRWVGDSALLDVLADLDALRRSLIDQRADALATGNHSAASTAAQRQESVTLNLLREHGVTSDETIFELRRLSLLGTALTFLGQEGDYPEALTRLAEIIGSLHFSGSAPTAELLELRDGLAAAVLDVATP
jgi:hypothetical protein